MGVLLLVSTLMFLLAALVTAVASLFANAIWMTKFAACAAAVWLTLYIVLFAAVSFTSRERTLGAAEAKEFCGFYIDCHLQAQVTGVRTTENIGGVRAAGRFYIVRVRVFSNARNPSIAFHLITPSIEVQDENGSRYERNSAAEELLPTAAVQLDGDIRGTEMIEKELVFDLPSEIQRPRLDIREGYGIDHAIEAVLIGDEDSIFHKRNYFDLTEQNIASGVK